MQVGLSTIPEDGRDVRFSKGSDWFFHLLRQEDRYDFSLDRIDVHCLLKKVRANVTVLGEIVTGIDLECCRCLEMFRLPVRTEFDYTFFPDPGDSEEDLELSNEELGMNYYRDDLIDIDHIVVEQIILQIPVKPLCKFSCKGLCKICGINLNVVGCNHQVETSISPFANLKDLKIKKGK